MKKLISISQSNLTRSLIAISILLLQVYSLKQDGFSQSLFKSSEMSQVGMLGANDDGGWVMSSSDIESQGFVAFDQDNKFSVLKGFNFSIDVNSLKSMRDTHDQLFHNLIKAETHPRILFTADSVNIRNDYGDKYIINVSGNLLIAGIQKPVVLELTGRMNAGKKLNLCGSIKIKLSEYNVSNKAARKIANNEMMLTLNLLLENEPMLAANKE